MLAFKTLILCEILGSYSGVDENLMLYTLVYRYHHFGGAWPPYSV